MRFKLTLTLALLTLVFAALISAAVQNARIGPPGRAGISRADRWARYAAVSRGLSSSADRAAGPSEAQDVR